MAGGEGDAGGESGVTGSELATLQIRCTNGPKFAVRTDLGVTVAEFKAIVAESCDVPAPQQRLIYKDRILKDEQTLASYVFLAAQAAPSELLDSSREAYLLPPLGPALFSS